MRTLWHRRLRNMSFLLGSIATLFKRRTWIFKIHICYGSEIFHRKEQLCSQAAWLCGHEVGRWVWRRPTLKVSLPGRQTWGGDCLEEVFLGRALQIVTYEGSGGNRTGRQEKLNYDAAPAGTWAAPTESPGTKVALPRCPSWRKEVGPILPHQSLELGCPQEGLYLRWGIFLRLGAIPTESLSWGWLTRPACSQQPGNKGLRPKGDLGSAPEGSLHGTTPTFLHANPRTIAPRWITCKA